LTGGIVVDPHVRLDVMAAVAGGRDLQHTALVADCVVLLPDAEDVLEEACERHERRAGLFRRPGEAGVVSGEVFVGSDRPRPCR
jgi:hypothetical protein